MGERALPSRRIPNAEGMMEWKITRTAAYKYWYRQDFVMDGKITGLKFEGKHNICIVISISTKIFVNYKEENKIYSGETRQTPLLPSDRSNRTNKRTYWHHYVTWYKILKRTYIFNLCLIMAEYQVHLEWGTFYRITVQYSLQMSKQQKTMNNQMKTKCDERHGTGKGP